MLMIIRVPSPSSPINAIHLLPQHLRSRFQFMDLSAHFQSSSFYYEKRLHSQLFSFQAAQPVLAENSKRVLWSIRSNVDSNPTNNNQGTTRLFRTIQAFQMKINTRIQELRRDLPKKLLFLLIGYYCATAFSTVIGQTGDWDILSSALAMFIVEGIGALVYRITLPSSSWLRRMLALLNFWKAGLTLGLFMDSFKY